MKLLFHFEYGIPVLSKSANKQTKMDISAVFPLIMALGAKTNF